MSWEATNWVIKHTSSRNAATQCLLFVIANASDPDGVAFGWWKSRDHWWNYLVKHTRLSRGAVFRLLTELEDKGYFTREEIKPEGGGRAQPVIKLHLERTILEPERIIQSTAATEEDERTPSETVPQSTAATQKEPPESLPGRPPESPLATTEDVTLNRTNTPQSPPCKPKGIDEANGFGAFWNDYPDHQAMNRKSALAAFAELTALEQQQVVRTVGFYARDIAKLKRRPVSAVNWLKERRFTEYGAGRQASSGTGSLQLVPEATPPWQAWLNVAAVAYGGQPKVPYFWNSQGQRGMLRPSQWPAGGEAWLVPFDRWIFVESGTAQHGRWCERISEMFNRMPVPVRLTMITPARLVLAHGIELDQRSEQHRNPQGLFVPLEWPPPKGTQQTKDHAA